MVAAKNPGFTRDWPCQFVVNYPDRLPCCVKVIKHRILPPPAVARPSPAAADCAEATTGQPHADLHPALKTAIARAAVEGRPYTKTGGNGVYERRHELPEAFHTIGKHRLAEWVGALLDREELVMAMAEGSKLVKWLDVPDGPVARGEAVFITGHLSRSQPGMKDGA